MSIVDSPPSLSHAGDPAAERVALPLAAVHRELGARLASPAPAPAPGAAPSISAGGGAAAAPAAAATPLVPMSYGSVGDEYEALRRGCGLADRSWVGRLEMAGADRLRFLHAYVTCEVKALAAGQGAYGFFTSPQGRILADVVVSAQADRLCLELAAGQAEAIAAHLRKYLIADRVEIGPLRLLPLTLAGPGAAAVLAGKTSGIEVPQALWSHVSARLAGAEVGVQRTGRLGLPAFTVWVEEQEAVAVWRELLAGGAAVPVGHEALELVRAEAGIARFGLDFGPQNFPQETGAEAEAVSYTKGCYLGQEVVARIHYRGGVQKSLCGLLFAGAEGAGLPAPRTPLLFEGREAGVIGTVVHSLALRRPIGLAILHRRAAAAGTRLELGESGGPVAEVAALPFLDR
jgi:folate-binding protein YgfZ